jgi:cell division protein FtsI/penicillin-binding protein 2
MLLAKDTYYKVILFCSLVTLSINAPGLAPDRKEKLVKKINQELLSADSLDQELDLQANSRYDVELTIEPKWQKYVEDLVKRSGSAYSAIVIANNRTGEIKAMAGYDRNKKKFDNRLCLDKSAPAASIVKIVSAANLVQHHGFQTQDSFTFRGRPNTLYRHQVFTKSNRGRKITLKQAFKHSNNVVFGKASVRHSNIGKLKEMANSFYFGKKVLPFLSFEENISLFPSARDPYTLSQLASGLNKVTLISPVHAVKISQLIANRGRDIPLSLVKNIFSIEQNQQKNLVYTNRRFMTEHPQVIDARTSVALQKMMEEVVNSGSARSVGRFRNRHGIHLFEIGGKTGSMSGGFPYGRRDWFTFYIRPNEMEYGGISVSIMLVNLKNWRVRSTGIAKKIIEYYYKNFYGFNSVASR